MFLQARSQTNVSLFHYGSYSLLFRSKRVLFVTNNSALGSKGLHEKFTRLGLGGEEADCVTAASALALFLKVHHPGLRRCYGAKSREEKEAKRTSGGREEEETEKEGSEKETSCSQVKWFSL